MVGAAASQTAVAGAAALSSDHPMGLGVRAIRMVLPVPSQVVVVPGEPVPAARRSIPIFNTGTELTVRIETEYKVGPPKPKYKWLELEVELEAPLLKTRFGELKASRSLSVSREHKSVGFTTKSTITLEEGKLKLWDLYGDVGLFSKGALTVTGEIATAIALESAILAAELEAQQKAQVEISVIRLPRNTGLTLGVGVGAGATGRLPIWVMRPGKEPDEERDFRPAVLHGLCKPRLALLLTSLASRASHRRQ